MYDSGDSNELMLSHYSLPKFILGRSGFGAGEQIPSIVARVLTSATSTALINGEIIVMKKSKLILLPLSSKSNSDHVVRHK